LISWILSLPAAVFGFAVGLFAFFGLAIFSLCLSMVPNTCRVPASIAAVCLSSPTASADAKNGMAPTTLDLKQQHRRACLRSCKQPEDAIERICGL
jgi:hypothetical protein